MNRSPIPLRPDFSAVRSRAGQSLIRAATAHLLCRAKGQQLDDVLKECWGKDRDVELVTRATTTPATMTNSPWAAGLVGASVLDFVGLLGPASASAAIFERTLQFRFDRSGAIILPSFTAAASNADFIGELAPIPVIQFDTSAKVVLTPKKFATISVFTRETFEHAVPTIENVVRSTLAESIGLALDSKLLDANVASTTRPAGLRAGIAALTASSETIRADAMAADIATLVGAVAAVANNAPILLIAAPAQAAALRLWNRVNLNYEVFASSGLASGVVVALASNCLVSALDPLPRFEIMKDATAHFDGSAPLDISTAAVAATVKSLFQSDLIGLRVVQELAWGLRSSTGLAWITGTNW